MFSSQYEWDIKNLHQTSVNRAVCAWLKFMEGVVNNKNQPWAGDIT